LHHANRPIVVTGNPLPGRLAGSRLAGCRADDPAGALDRQAVEGAEPRPGTTCQVRGVEAFADDEDSVAGVRVREPVAFCPDNITQGTESLADYAAELIDSAQWEFWWD
jgi:hypothetical protein